MLAGPLRVLDAGLARAGHAVGHAASVTARVGDLPQVGLIGPELVIVSPHQGLVTRSLICHVCLTSLT